VLLSTKPAESFSALFISKASRRAFLFFLSVQQSQPEVATGHTSAIDTSRIFVEIGKLLFSERELKFGSRKQHHVIAQGN